MPQYCTVHHRVDSVKIDGEDTGRDPDRIPVSGTIVFTPLLGKGDSVVITENGVESTLNIEPVTAQIQLGQLMHRGELGVKLFAGGEGSNPERIRWRATFKHLIAGTTQVTLKDVLFEAVPGGEVTLSMAQPVPGKPYPGYSATIEAGIAQIADTAVSYLDLIEGARDEALGEVSGAVDIAIGDRLDTKADKTVVDSLTGLVMSAIAAGRRNLRSIRSLDAALTTKADQGAVTTALSTKADRAELEAGLATKATNSRVDSLTGLVMSAYGASRRNAQALSTKADRAELEAGLATKATNSRVDSLTGLVMSAYGASRRNAQALSTKADRAELEAIAQRPPKSHRREWITTMQPGYGWVAGGTTGGVPAISDDPTDAALGTSSLKWTATTPGTTGWVEKSGLGPIDTRGKHLIVWIKANDLSKISSVTVLAGNDTFNHHFRLASWLTSSAGQKATVNNRWTPMYFDWHGSNHSGTPDRANITGIRVRVATSPTVSEENPLEVHIGGVGLVAAATELYPRGVVSLTFDDGFQTQYTEGKRIMDQYGYPGTMYVIANRVGAPDSSYITWEQLYSLRDHSGWEIGSHAYSEEVNLSGLADIPIAEAEADILAQKAWLEDHGFPAESHCYTGGRFNGEVVEMLKKHFTSARTTVSFPPFNLVPPTDPMLLTQVDIGGSLESLKAHIDRAVEQGNWVTVMIHRLEGDNVTKFQGLVDHIAQSGIDVATVQEVIDRSRYLR